MNKKRYVTFTFALVQFDERDCITTSEIDTLIDDKDVFVVD